MMERKAAWESHQASEIFCTLSPLASPSWRDDVDVRVFPNRGIISSLIIETLRPLLWKVRFGPLSQVTNVAVFISAHRLPPACWFRPLS